MTQSATPEPCLIPDCTRRLKAKGLCRAHYEQAHRPRRSRPERLLRNRARSRALTALALMFPDEFEHLEREMFARVTEENRLLRGQLAAIVEGDPLDAPPGDGVVALRPGPRGEDQPLLDRAAVVTEIGRFCATCATFHETDHDCPACARRTETDRVRTANTSKARDRIRRLLLDGKPPQWVIAQGESAAEVVSVVRELIAERNSHRTG